MKNLNSVYAMDQCAACGECGDACLCQPKTKPIIRTMFRGDDFVFDVVVQRSPVPGSTPVPIDITGFSMWCTVKRSTVDPDSQAVAQVTQIPTSVPPGGGIVYTLPTAGQARITIPNMATRNFPDGLVRMPYDVQVKDLSSLIFTVEAGIIVVIPDVTRAIA